MDPRSVDTATVNGGIRRLDNRGGTRETAPDGAV